MALQEHERLATGAEHSQGVHDQASADRLTLTIGAYSNGAQHQHVNEPTGSVDERMRVQDLADERSVDLSHERQLVVPCPARSQPVEEQAEGRVTTERSDRDLSN